jgi:hypothetical protein
MPTGTPLIGTGSFFTKLDLHKGRSSFVNEYEALCKLSMFSIHFSQHFSSWIIVLVTIERYIVTAYPLKARQMCTLKRAKLYVLCLASILFLINLPTLFFPEKLTRKSNDTKTFDFEATSKQLIFSIILRKSKLIKKYTLSLSYKGLILIMIKCDFDRQS